MLSGSRKAPLNTAYGSNGSTSETDVTATRLYRWQGSLILVQVFTVENLTVFIMKLMLQYFLFFVDVCFSEY